MTEQNKNKPKEKTNRARVGDVEIESSTESMEEVINAVLFMLNQPVVQNKLIESNKQGRNYLG